MTNLEKILEEFEKKVGGGLSSNPDFKKEVKEFVLEVYNQALQAQKIETLEQSRVILMKVLEEVEKEHGSPNVYFDMTEELYTEKINEEIIDEEIKVFTAVKEILNKEK